MESKAPTYEEVVAMWMKELREAREAQSKERQRRAEHMLDRIDRGVLYFPSENELAEDQP